MSSTTTNIPEVYVLWHPACSLGEVLARSIHAWLRPGSGLGPQVYYRCLPAPHTPAGSLPLPLPTPTSDPVRSGRARVVNLQIVLPLVDENMVADPAWRHWLSRLLSEADPGCRREILPVALDATAYNLPTALRELNFLRPAGLPLAGEAEAIAAYEKRRVAAAAVLPRPDAGVPAADKDGADRVEATVRSLLKQLTEAMCRLLLARNTGASARPTRSGSAAPPKVTIFLSHAKADGTGPARRLRDYIYSQTQLAAFYDENDIAFGHIFRQVLQQDLEAASTAALIAVRSARYARRPWCRRELSLFRQPRREAQDKSGGERWRLYPVLMVDAMEGAQESWSIPECGNAPVIRWDAGQAGIEEQVITTVVRDAMLAAFHSALGAAIQLTGNRLVINWLPDPTTLLSLPRVREDEELDIIHPGQGLSGLDLDILYDFFPRLTFHSFEEVLT